jgi:hypothetical protein
VRGPGVDQFEGTKKFILFLNERPDLKSKCCRRRLSAGPRSRPICEAMLNMRRMGVRCSRSVDLHMSA